MLSHSRRLTKNKDWKKVHRFGRTFFSPEIVLKVKNNHVDEPTRFGLIVGTKISKKAVVRNRIKRQLRAIISQIVPKSKNGHEVALITRPSVAVRTFAELREIVKQLLIQAKLLK